MDKDIASVPSTNFDEAFDNISTTYENKPMCTMNDLEDIAKSLIASLPRLNRDALRKEMAEMHVPTYQNPTTFDINKGLQIAQGYKDRLSEIYMLTTNEYRIRKRCMEMLYDANSVISKASSADKRKGEAIMKYPIWVLALEAAEAFHEEVEQMMSNIKSAGESISRQGSILQLQVQLGEYRKRVPTESNSDAEEMDYKSGAPKLNLEWGDI